MKRLCVAGVILAVAVACVAQEPRPASPGRGTSLPGLPDLAQLGAPPLPPPAPGKEPPPTQAPPKEPWLPASVTARTVEDLLARLDTLQAQQAELDKAKKETVALLKEKLKQQKQRLQKLGVGVEEEAGPAPTNTTGSLDPLVGPRVAN